MDLLLNKVRPFKAMNEIVKYLHIWLVISGYSVLPLVVIYTFISISYHLKLIDERDEHFFDIRCIVFNKIYFVKDIWKGFSLLKGVIFVIVLPFAPIVASVTSLLSLFFFIPTIVTMLFSI
jgi:hypothetical protein